MRTAYILGLSIALVVALEAVYHGIRFGLRRRSEELKRRLQALGSSEPDRGLLRRTRFARHPALDAALRDVAAARWTEGLLASADARLTVAQLWTWSAALVVAALVASVALRLGPLGAALLAGGAGALPTLLVSSAADRRSRKLSEQLPDALDMIARSLRAGHATSAAFQMVATEMPEPVSVEFARVFEEHRLGLPLEDVMKHLVQRSPRNGDLKIFATSVIIQKETGGNLAELLGGIADTIRARYRFAGKLRALTAEGRASAVVLTAMPLVFVAGLQLVNPGYLAPLLEGPTGHRVLAYAFLSWAAGVLWLHRLTKLDV